MGTKATFRPVICLASKGAMGVWMNTLVSGKSRVAS